MEFQWKGHTIKITGCWTLRWLYMAPDYELWIDDQRLDRRGGPRLQPRLEAIYEDENDELHHIEATIMSIAGVRPRCDILIEGQPVAQGRVRVENFLNPILLIIILVSTLIMFMLGPEVIQNYLNLR